MKKKLYNAFRLLRPRQWIKNFAIFAAVLFSGQLFDLTIFRNVTLAFIVFCFFSSAIYIVNDIFDREKDRLHPFKRFRPIANGDIKVPYAMSLSLVLTLVAFFISLSITPAFVLCVIVYLILQISYSAFLKHIAILDILAIAAGYII